MSLIGTESREAVTSETGFAIASEDSEEVESTVGNHKGGRMNGQLAVMALILILVFGAYFVWRNQSGR